MTISLYRRSALHLLAIFLLTHILSSFAQLTFPPSKINIIDENITFYFEFIDETKTVRMGLEMNQAVEAFGIGFAPEEDLEMRNYDMVKFKFHHSGNVTIKDLYSTTLHPPPPDSVLGGSENYILVDSYVGDGKTQVLFERAYDTGDEYDFPFSPGQNESIAFAWGFKDKGRRLLGKERYISGNFVSHMYNGLNRELMSMPSFKKIDSYLMIFFFAVVIDIGLWIARYQTSSKYVAKAHHWFTLFLYAGAVFGVAIIGLRREK